MFLAIAATALLHGMLAAHAPPGEEACAALLPKAVHEAIGKAYAGFRLVRVADYSPDDIASERQYHADHSCIGVATADVNSDRLPDYAFLITFPSGHTLLVSALSSAPSSWHAHTLMDFGSEGPGGSFVNSIEAGSYKDLYALANGPGEFLPERGRVQSYRSRQPGFTAGSIGSSTIAFFYTGKRWIHLWLSD